MAQNVARLGVIFGMDSAEFETGLKKVGRGLDSIQEKMKTVGAVAVLAFTAMTAKALEYSDRISDVATANEVAIKTVMALSEGLAQNGGDAENAGKLLSSFTAHIDAFAQGGKEAQITFARLGISLKDVGTKDMTSLFDQAITSLAGMDDAVSRNAIAMTIFGKASKGVDFKGLSEGTAEARLKFAEYADAVSKAGDLHDKLDAKATKTMIMFTNAFIPTLNQVFDALNKSGGAMEIFFEYSGKGFKNFVTGISYATAFLKVYMETWSVMIDLIKDPLTGKGFDLENKLKNLENFYQLEMHKADDFRNKILFPDKFGDQETKKPPTPFTGRQVTPYKDTASENQAKKLQEGLAMAEKISDEYKRQLQFSYDELQIQGQMNFMTEKEKNINEAVLKVREDTSKKLNEIQNKMEEYSVKGEKLNQPIINQLEKEKKEVILLGLEYEELTRKEKTRQEESQRTFSSGWNKAFKQASEDAENYSTLGTKAYETMSSNITSAIDTFVETGKLSFADFASSIIKELLKVELRMQAMSLFRAGLSFLGSAFASPTPFAPNPSGGALPIGDVSIYGDGGQLDIGQPSIVGDKGPELIIPSRAGTVIPNNKISDMLGSGQTINYNAPYIANMSAIDTQSATQFLAQNKQTIWAVNQSASRSMPTSR